MTPLAQIAPRLSGPAGRAQRPIILNPIKISRPLQEQNEPKRDVFQKRNQATDTKSRSQSSGQPTAESLTL